jgi:hypothetical protein
MIALSLQAWGNYSTVENRRFLRFAAQMVFGGKGGHRRSDGMLVNCMPFLADYLVSDVLLRTYGIPFQPNT